MPPSQLGKWGDRSFDGANVWQGSSQKHEEKQIKLIFVFFKNNFLDLSLLRLTSIDIPNNATQLLNAQAGAESTSLRKKERAMLRRFVSEFNVCFVELLTLRENQAFHSEGDQGWPGATSDRKLVT